MNIPSSSSSPRVQVPARPADDFTHTVQKSLREALAKNYAIFVDCTDATGAMLSGVEGRLLDDLADRGGRVVGDSDAMTFENGIVLVYGEDDACESICKLLNGVFPVLSLTSRPDTLTMSIEGRAFATLDAPGHDPSAVPRNLDNVLAIAREVGVGAEVLSYGGAYADAMVAAGLKATYPLHGVSSTELSARQRAGMIGFGTILRP